MPHEDHEDVDSLLQALRKRAMPIEVSYWADVPQLGEQHFFIVTSWYYTKGHDSCQQAVADALNEAGIKVPARRIHVVGSDTRLKSD